MAVLLKRAVAWLNDNHHMIRRKNCNGGAGRNFVEGKAARKYNRHHPRKRMIQ
jgi:hypothetical protein